MAILLIVTVLGLIFAESALAVTRTYNLYATDTYVAMADGTIVYCYGFVGGEAGVPLTYQNSMKPPKGVIAGGNTTIAGGAPNPAPGPMTLAEQQLFGNAQFPAPVIYAAVDDVVEIRLKNLGVSTKTAPNDPHTIHLHGLDVSAANDGVPETSLAAVPANAGKGTPGAGNVVVYMFAPEYAGTYMYHCHQEADIHVQMGMYGALVVYNPSDPAYVAGLDDATGNADGKLGGPGQGNGGSLYGWDYDKDYVFLLSEFDLGQHVAEQFAGARGGYNPVNYKPQYWFINGLSFPNTIHAGVGFNWATWFASHPNYDPFIVGSLAGGTSAPAGEQVLLRVINMGFQTQPMHMHGYHAKVIGSDQRAWPWTYISGLNSYGDGLEKNTLTVGSGETYEWIIDFSQQKLATGRYDAVTGTQTVSALARTQSRYDPLTLAPRDNTAVWPATTKYYPAIPDMFVPGFAYIGGPVVGPLSQADQGFMDAAGALPALPPELPITTGQYFPFHNHDDYKATNNGVYPGGQFTMIMTQP
ncbi:MAG: multicopper oxidase domain-containing protein [Coriobacteriia bacterium]|nr:multicopper oxidase domain-containing protein [Coriobacteriia bacterium]